MEYEQTYPPAVPAFGPAPPTGRTPWGIADMAKAIGVIIIALVAIGMPAFVVAVEIAGDADRVEDDHAAMAVLEGASALLQLVFLASVAWFSVHKYRVGWSALGLRPPERGGWWGGLVLFFAAMIVFGVYVGILDLAGVNAEGNVSDPEGNVPRIVILGLLALGLAPFIEEILFRGFIFGGLRGRWGVAGGAVASALLFGAVHFQDSSSLPILPAIALIGLLFCAGYHYTGSLLAPMTAHFVFNALSFVVSIAGVGS